uniref:DNA replication licensing factor MCM5 n=1 Tax=Macrostomum lignano TaxID=282301 RepID=A0A1I8F9E6_9PLAT
MRPHRPCNRVSIVGVYSVRGQAPKGSGNLGGPGVRATYVRALGIALEESSHGIGGAPSDEEEEEFRRLAAKPDIQERLARSIAPSILGSVDVKKAICCLLFGGSRKRMPDGLYRRATSTYCFWAIQLLKFVEKCAPIAVYTSGKGSSAAGLTASVIRDPSSRGFVMEGGAMVLADGGVVAIDEFDKMREDDRVAIHEAMEQQTISVAKAGITTTLNSRCSVLAAANSVFGRWDETRAAGENIDFMPTILSRFDMIFIVKDEHSEARDTEMARHVLQVHLRGSVFGAAAEAAAAGGAPAVSEDEVPLDKLRRYISFCRDRCGPRLSEAAAARLENAYVAMRGEAKEIETAAASSAGAPCLASTGEEGCRVHPLPSAARQVIPITVRQLEALCASPSRWPRCAWPPSPRRRTWRRRCGCFRVSTLDAAKEGSLAGAEGFTSQHDHEQLVQAERQVKRRFLIGSQVSESTIVTDFVRQGYPEPVVQKVLSLMLRRGEIQYRMQRRILYRVK